MEPQVPQELVIPKMEPLIPKLEPLIPKMEPQVPQELVIPDNTRFNSQQFPGPNLDSAGGARLNEFKSTHVCSITSLHM